MQNKKLQIYNVPTAINFFTLFISQAFGFKYDFYVVASNTLYEALHAFFHRATNL